MDSFDRMVAWKDTYVSTGHLPPDKQVAEYVAEAHARFAHVDDGHVSQVYPALAEMPRDLFGVSMVDVEGDAFETGDTQTEFTIMSVSKPFLFAYICEQIGPGQVREKIGMNATGMAFNSLAGIERDPNGRTNPMVNAGAIASTSLARGSTHEERWQFALKIGLLVMAAISFLTILPAGRLPNYLPGQIPEEPMAS